MKDANPYCGCLYFSSNALARTLTKLGEDAFSSTGLSPSHAFLLMAALRTPGIQPMVLSNQLLLTPSTITRLIEKLEARGLVMRKTEGKSTKVYPTSDGKKMEKSLKDCWSGLYRKYSEVLGEKNSKALTDEIYKATVTLDGM